MSKSKVGRPRLPDSQKKVYQRVSVRPNSYLIFKKISGQNNIEMIRLFEILAEELEMGIIKIK